MTVLRNARNAEIPLLRPRAFGKRSRIVLLPERDSLGWKGLSLWKNKRKKRL
jgi:hypothetical protein